MNPVRKLIKMLAVIRNLAIYTKIFYVKKMLGLIF